MITIVSYRRYEFIFELKAVTINKLIKNGIEDRVEGKK